MIDPRLARRFPGLVVPVISRTPVSPEEMRKSQDALILERQPRDLPDADMEPRYAACWHPLATLEGSSLLCGHVHRYWHTANRCADRLNKRKHAVGIWAVTDFPSESAAVHATGLSPAIPPPRPQKENPDSG